MTGLLLLLPLHAYMIYDKAFIRTANVHKGSVQGLLLSTSSWPCLPLIQHPLPYSPAMFSNYTMMKQVCPHWQQILLIAAQFLLPLKLRVWVWSTDEHYHSKVTSITSLCLCKVNCLRPSLTLSNTTDLVYTLVSSWLFQLPSLWFAARIISRAPSVHHISPVLQQHHWFQVKYCIDLKILLQIFKAISLSHSLITSTCVVTVAARRGRLRFVAAGPSHSV